MKRMKILKIGLGIVLTIAGLACAWFWGTAFKQQAELATTTMIRTPEDLSEQLLVLSTALKMLDVDVFTPSDDPGIGMKLNGQLLRGTLCGVVLFLLGSGLLLLARSESKGIRITLVTGRSIVIALLCFSCLLIWSSWYNRNTRLPVIKIDGSPNQQVEPGVAPASHQKTFGEILTCLPEVQSGMTTQALITLLGAPTDMVQEYRDGIEGSIPCFLYRQSPPDVGDEATVIAVLITNNTVWKWEKWPISYTITKKR